MRLFLRGWASGGGRLGNDADGRLLDAENWPIIGGRIWFEWSSSPVGELKLSFDWMEGWDKTFQTEWDPAGLPNAVEKPRKHFAELEVRVLRDYSPDDEELSRVYGSKGIFEAEFLLSNEGFSFIVEIQAKEKVGKT